MSEQTQTEEDCRFANQFPYVDLASMVLDRDHGHLLSKEISTRIDGICVGQPSDDRLTVVVSDPTEIEIYNIVEVSTQGRFKPVLMRGDRQLVRLAREFIFDVPAVRRHETWQEWLESKRFSTDDFSLDSGKEGETEQEITGKTVEMANRIITEAIALGVSDIHLETFEHALLVRYRTDGVLRVVDEVKPLADARALVKRFKVMAKIDVTQERINQGGRISVRVGDLDYDLRVSVVPVPGGQSMVMRLLNKGDFKTSLQDLGFSEKQLDLYRQLIHNPHGMILTCGPTGSGKSTTLFASLNEIVRPDRKVMTVEDPIEYRVPGVVQVQTNTAPREAEKRVTFANTLREFLRQDPDVMLVGEIRDQETAHVAVQAALTGHLVFSTLHTNDAVGAINRMKQMGVEPFLLASTILGVVAQRLVRRTCSDCAQPVEPSERELEMFGSRGISSTDLNLREGVGCESCRRTGFRGRVGLFEMLAVTEEIQDLIERDATKLEIYRQAVRDGMHTLLDDALAKAAQGLISMLEVQRVCKLDLRGTKV
ncbi:MAG: type II/IV secretion system protein [Candidatus Eremiobacteraeota bacterium]|nr:type II/IV secretion system protein [Candidatus Eremiobacteraeota bacterium]